MKKVKVKITNCKVCGSEANYFKSAAGDQHSIECPNCLYIETSANYKVVVTWWCNRPVVVEKEIEMEVEE